MLKHCLQTRSSNILILGSLQTWTKSVLIRLWLILWLWYLLLPLSQLWTVTSYIYRTLNFQMTRQRTTCEGPCCLTCFNCTNVALEYLYFQWEKLLQQGKKWGKRKEKCMSFFLLLQSYENKTVFDLVLALFFVLIIRSKSICYLVNVANTSFYCLAVTTSCLRSCTAGRS